MSYSCTMTWTDTDPASPTFGETVTVEITATETEDGVQFHVELVEGQADLNGFFLDIDNDGGELDAVEGEPSINMEGGSSNEEGDEDY